MPSDEKAREVLEVLSGPRARFDESLMLTIEEIQGFLAMHRDPEEDSAGRVAMELGTFAAGRIDTERFAALMKDHGELDHEIRHELDVALETLTRLHERGDSLFLAQVAQGGDLRDAVARALAEIGRAFAAARLVKAARTGGGEAELDASRNGFPFPEWSVEERKVAPPLVVTLHGEDLVAGGLMEFLDGSLKIGLVANSKGPPAPLAELLLPGLWVEQAGDVEALTGFGASAAPGIAAVMSDGAALFRHDPGAGDSVTECLTVESLPESDPRTRIGRVSVAQQLRALNQLKTLRSLVEAPAPQAAPPEVAAEPAPTAAAAAAQPVAVPAEADAAGQLAGWLLSQTDLTGA